MTSDVVVAALFVETDGVYFGLPNVDPWDEARDARLYDGPWPVVAHPPCARWSRLAGFVQHVHGYKRGEDGGCFQAALEAVHRFGGDGGASCYVEQGRYGELPVKKATWLYAYGVDLPDVLWGYTPDRAGEPLPPGVHGMNRWRDQVSYRPKLRRGWRINEPRDGANAIVTAADGRMRDAHASRTPILFRDALIAMAASAA